MKPTLEDYTSAIEWLEEEKKYLAEVDEQVKGIKGLITKDYRRGRSLWTHLRGRSKLPTDEFTEEYITHLDSILSRTDKRRRDKCEELIDLVSYLDVPSRDFLRETSMDGTGLDDEVLALKDIDGKTLIDIEEGREKTIPVVEKTIEWITGLESLLRKSRSLLYSCPELFTGDEQVVEDVIAKFSEKRRIEYLTTVAEALPALPKGTKEILVRLMQRHVTKTTYGAVVDTLEKLGEDMVRADVYRSFGRYESAASIFEELGEWKLAGDTLLEEYRTSVPTGKLKTQSRERYLKKFDIIKELYMSGELWEEIVEICKEVVSFRKNTYPEGYKSYAAEDISTALAELAEAYAKVGEIERTKESWLEAATTMLDKKEKPTGGYGNDWKTLEDFWAETSNYLVKALGSEKESWRFIGDYLDKVEHKSAAYEKAGEILLAAKVLDESKYPHRYRSRVASLYERAGELELAAERYSDTVDERIKAATLYEKLEHFDRAASLYEKEGLIKEAAAMYEKAGDTETARLLRVKAIVAGEDIFPEPLPVSAEGGLSLCGDSGALSLCDEEKIK